MIGVARGPGALKWQPSGSRPAACESTLNAARDLDLSTDSVNKYPVVWTNSVGSADTGR